MFFSSSMGSKFIVSILRCLTYSGRIERARLVFWGAMIASERRNTNITRVWCCF